MASPANIQAHNPIFKCHRITPCSIFFLRYGHLHLRVFYISLAAFLQPTVHTQFQKGFSMKELSCRSALHPELLGFSQLVPHLFPGNQSQSHRIPKGYLATKGKPNTRSSKLISNMRGTSLLWWKAETMDVQHGNVPQQGEESTRTRRALASRHGTATWDGIRRGNLER